MKAARLESELISIQMLPFTCSSTLTSGHCAIRSVGERLLNLSGRSLMVFAMLRGISAMKDAKKRAESTSWKSRVVEPTTILNVTESLAPPLSPLLTPWIERKRCGVCDREEEVWCVWCVWCVVVRDREEEVWCVWCVWCVVV